MSGGNLWIITSGVSHGKENTHALKWLTSMTTSQPYLRLHSGRRCGGKVWETQGTSACHLPATYIERRQARDYCGLVWPRL